MVVALTITESNKASLMESIQASIWPEQQQIFFKKTNPQHTWQLALDMSSSPAFTFMNYKTLFPKPPFHHCFLSHLFYYRQSSCNNELGGWKEVCEI